MTYFDYSNVSYSIRGDIPAAYQAYWAKLGAPGSWWSGEQRIAIAQESRNALTCSFCAARKSALSPYAFEGEHEVMHRAPESVERTLVQAAAPFSEVLYGAPDAVG